jgi:hypothetical protein
MTAWTLPPGRWCLPEYQGVDLLALHAGHLLRDAVGGEQLAVQDHEGDAFLPGPFQGLVQARGLHGENLGALADVPVRGGAGDAVVAAGLLNPGAVPEPPQDQDCLLTAGQRPASGRGAPQAPFLDQQAGDEAKQLHGHVKRGTIGDHVESSVAKKFCGKTSSTGTPRLFPGTSRVSASLP